MSFAHSAAARTDGRTWQVLLFRLVECPATATARRDAWHAHVDFLREACPNGHVVAAGPIRDNQPLNWVVVTDSPTPAAALASVRSDPAVTLGMFAVEAHAWTGPPRVGPSCEPMPSIEKGLPPSDRLTLVLVRPGPASRAESRRLRARQIDRLARELRAESIVAAGPCFDDSDLSGLIVLRGKNFAEIHGLAGSLQAVRKRRVVLEPHAWDVASHAFREPTHPASRNINRSRRARSR